MDEECHQKMKAAVFSMYAGLLLQIFSKHNLSLVSHQFTTYANTCYTYNLFYRDLVEGWGKYKTHFI